MKPPEVQLLDEVVAQLERRKARTRRPCQVGRTHRHDYWCGVHGATSQTPEGPCDGPRPGALDTAIAKARDTLDAAYAALDRPKVSV